MADHDATTLTFVRTPAGVVKVPAGQRVPRDVLPGELDRLVRAGAVREAEAIVPPLVPPPVDDPDPTTDDPTTDETVSDPAPVKARPRRPRKNAED